MNYEIEFTKKIKVTDEDIDDIMSTALEGGINYWCNKAEVVGEYLGEFASEQISRGGTLKFYDAEDGAVYGLTKEMLLEGIEIAAKENYYCEYEWVTGEKLDPCEIDANVADCIVQLALFGEIVFG